MANQDWTTEYLSQRVDESSANYGALMTQLIALQLQMDELRAQADDWLSERLRTDSEPHDAPAVDDVAGAPLPATLEGPPDYLPFGTGDGVLWRVLQAADLPSELDKPLHINTSDAHIRLAEANSNPSAPVAGAEVNLYLKADKLVIQFTHGAGDTHYYTLDLTAHAAAWAYAASAP